MTLQGSVNIAYPIGEVIMSPSALANYVVGTISIIPNTMQIWKQKEKHLKLKTMSFMLSVLQIFALLLGI